MPTDAAPRFEEGNRHVPPVWSGVELWVGGGGSGSHHREIRVLGRSMLDKRTRPLISTRLFASNALSDRVAEGISMGIGSENMTASESTAQSQRLCRRVTPTVDVRYIHMVVNFLHFEVRWQSKPASIAQRKDGARTVSRSRVPETLGLQPFIWLL